MALQGTQTADFTVKQLTDADKVVVALGKKSYSWNNGSAVEPADLTVETAAGETVGVDNYTVTYANNKNLGINTASVTVTFKGSVQIPAQTIKFSIERNETTSYSNATVALGTAAGAARGTGTKDIPAIYGAGPITPTLATFTVNGADQKAHVAMEYYTDAALTNKVTYINTPGVFYVKMMPDETNAAAGFTGAWVEPFYVKSDNLNGWTVNLSSSQVTDLTYTGKNVDTLKGPITLVNKANPTWKVQITDYTIECDQLIGAATTPTAGVTPNEAAKYTVTKITSTDTAFAGDISGAAITGKKTFEIKALDFSTIAQSDIKVAKSYSEKDGFTELDTTYTGAVQKWAGLTGANLFVRVNGVWNALPAADYKAYVNYNKTELGALDAGSYAVSVMTNSDNTFKSVVVENAVNVAKADLASVTAVAAKAGEALTVSYNGTNRALTDAALTGATATPVLGTDYVIEYYPVIKGIESTGSVSNPTDAGTYNMYVKALADSVNYTGTNKGVKTYAATVFTINKLAVDLSGSINVTNDLRDAYPFDAGKKIEPAVSFTIKDSGVAIPSSMYTFKYACSSANWAIGDTVTGTFALTEAGKVNYSVSGNLELDFDIRSDRDIRTCSVEVTGAPFEYAQTQDAKTGAVSAKVYDVTDLIVVKDAKGNVLDKSSYAVTTTSADLKKSAVGDYNVVVKGAGSYTVATDPTINTTWSIIKSDLSAAQVEGVKDYSVKLSGATPQSIWSDITGALKVIDSDGLVVQAAATNYTFAVDVYNETTKEWDAIANPAADVKAAGKYRVYANVASSQTGSSYEGETPKVEFEITAASLANAGIPALTAAGGDAYTGTAKIFTGISLVGGAFTALTYNTDFELSFYTDPACLNQVKDEEGNPVGPTNAGTYYVKAIGKGNFAGATSATGTYVITPKAIDATAISAAQIDYFGASWNPFSEIAEATADDGKLIDGTDYTVAYFADNKVATPKDAGVYKATFTSLNGNYKFTEGKQATATIAKADFKNAADNNKLKYDTIKAQRFINSATQIKPALTGIYIEAEDANGDSVKLYPAAGSDYVVSYGANNAVGVGTVVLNAAAADVTVSKNYEFSTSVTLNFDIVNGNHIGLAEVSPIEDQAMTGRSITPAPTVVLDGKTLIPGVDYYITYKNNTLVGVATAVIIGTGIYSGTQEVEFNIVKRAERIEGVDRYDTMSQVVTGAFYNASTVIIARGDIAPDALAAAGLGGALGDCPVLTTTTDALTPSTIKALTKLGATNAVILGTESSISANVVNQLSSFGITSQRIAGVDRADTAVQMYTQNKASYGRTAVIASGFSEADALSAASYAYAAKAPIFLANADGSLSSGTKAQLTAANFDRVIVLGGAERVSVAERSALIDIFGGKVIELGLNSNSRYTTSAEIVKFAVEEGVASYTKIYVATGAGFADAIAAGAPAGKQGAPVLLVDPAMGAESKAAIDEIIGANKDAISSIEILGGPTSVPASVAAYIDSLMK
ncbi:MAG: cell wall-binding repeat-containing protein [Raoultibacter sp.]